MGPIASQITSAGNSPVTDESPVQMASNAENVSIWWRHQIVSETVKRPLISVDASASQNDRLVSLTKIHGIEKAVLALFWLADRCAVKSHVGTYSAN